MLLERSLAKMLAAVALLFGLSVATASSPYKSPFYNRRSYVNYVPPVAVEYAEKDSFLDDDVLGPFTASLKLPSRRAVEKIPTIEERAEEHFPIRDAVEKRPPIDEYLQNFRSHTLQTQSDYEESAYRVVCFVTNWAYYRKHGTKFTPDYVDPKLCTHIVYAYASLNPDNYTIVMSDTVTDMDNGFYKKITSPEITSVSKVLISIGGWTDSEGDKYSKLVSSGNSRRKFVTSVIAFLRRHGFHGLHFDWNYPVCWQARCSQAHTSDRANFVKLIQELRQEFNKHNPRYVLAVGVSGYKEIIDVGYDVLNLSENVDFMSVMTYDYHGAWENKTGHLSPLNSNKDDQFPEYSVQSTLSTLLLMGAEPKKLIMGLPLYGQSFTLADAKRHGFGDASLEPGEPGEYTQQPGILSYSEICKRINKKGWNLERNQETGTESYAYKGNQWVGFDDKRSVRKKVNFMKKSGFGGVMVWTLDLDDYDNECCTGSYPLLREVNAAIGRIPANPMQTDCTKPVIVPLANETTTTPAGSTLEISEGTETTYVSSSTSTWPWAPTHESSSTTTSAPTSLWWPPTLTSRQTTSSRPSSYPTSESTTSTTEEWTTSSTSRPTSKPTYRPTKKPPKPTTTTTTSTSPPSSSEEPDNQVPEETTPGNNGQCVSGKYYADPTNCGSYYICVYGRKKQHFCAIGLHWNGKSQTCDWPSKANCWEHLVSEQAVESTTSMSTTPSYNRPVVGCENGEFYSVPGDCAAFYTCIDGRLLKRKCPSGLNWNQNSRLCDWRANTGCDESATTPSTEAYRKELTTKRTKVKHKGKPKAGCHKGLFSPHSSDCNKYYQCLWGEYKEVKCAPGLHWNKDMSICDWPQNSNCESIAEGGDEPEQEYHPVMTTSPASTSTSTKTTFWEWTEPSTSSTTSKIPSWTDTSWSWTEPPSSSSTSWDTWTPSTTTAATLPTTEPSYSLAKSNYKVVCYFTNWAWYRPGKGKFLPEDTDPNLCTHVVYGFTVLDSESLTIKVHDSWADIDNKFFERVVALKKRGIKATVAIGGWNDSAGNKYSRLVNNPTARANFISSVLRFLNKYGFDGLDLDWEYPKCWQNNCNQGPDSDKAAFSALVTELRNSFKQNGYLLSAAVSANKNNVNLAYDVPLLSEKLDWIAIMTYDFHGQWDKVTGHLAPIKFIPGDTIDYFNVEYAVNYWIKAGANPQKIVMGMPTYGQGFTLANPAVNGLNAPASGPSQAGEFTRAAGFLAYYEICQKVKNEGWTVVQDAQGRRGPYAYKGNQWVGYDDVHSIGLKVNMVKNLKLGGAMIWALDLDDFRNVCGGGHYTLLSTISKGLTDTSPGTDIDFGTGVEYPWSTSTIEVPSITGSSWTESTTKLTTVYRPTRPTRTTTKSYPTTSSTTPSYTTTSTTIAPTPDIDELPIEPENSYPGENNGVSSEWGSSSTSSTTSSTYAPVPHVPQEKFKVVCYFTNWAWYRQGNGKYMINDIDPDLCTHIIYAFAVLDPNKLVIKPHDSWADIENQFYEKVVALKKRNVKVLLAIGGWNDSAGNKYSRLVNSKQHRDRFVSHVVRFLRKYSFDGLDVDWEYPKCWQVNCKLGPSSDKKAFSDFISELREAFDGHGLLLSAAVSANRKVVDEGYDVPLLSNKLDWVSVMAYDYHGQWDEVTGHVAPMYEHPDDSDKNFNANFSIHYWVKKGADPRKIVMGMPMYGQSFTLATSKNNGLNARAYGGGEAGESTRARGFLSYYEICDRIMRKGWDVQFDVKGRMGPYAKRGTQWVSFDDQAMIRHKSQYVYYNNLGGAMIWALDLDDFRGSCNCGTYPLLKTINKVLRNYPGEVPECNFESNSRVDMKLFYQNEGLEMFNDEWKFENCAHGQVKKHPTDCTKYLTCSFGVYLQEQKCPGGLHFSEKRATCDWPHNADCKPSIMEYAEAYFLNNQQRQQTSLIVANNKTEPKYKVICYLTNWSSYRYNNLLFPIQALDSHLCTHLVYGFVILDPKTLTIKSNDTFTKLDNEFFKRVRVLKETGVKIMVALGGYNKLLNTRPARTQFIKHTVKFLKEHDFDGLELNWEYPSGWQTIPDKAGFTTLLRELKEAFWKPDFLLSVAVSPNRDLSDEAYDVPAISPYVDWFSLMAFDYHGYWEGKADHIAPIISTSNNNSDYLNIESSVSYWMEKGAPSNKIILGLPFYGQSFTLKNSNDHKIGSKILRPGNAARHTRVPGFAAFYEVCELTQQGTWKTVKDKNGHFTYLHDQWIAFNDVTDMRAKGKYIKENNLGGALAWALDLDDFINICGCGPNPLLTAINEELSSTDSYPKALDCAL